MVRVILIMYLKLYTPVWPSACRIQSHHQHLGEGVIPHRTKVEMAEVMK